MILNEQTTRVRFYLQNNSYGTRQVKAPIGWEEDEKEYDRHPRYHGLFTTYSFSLGFIKGDKKWIERVYETEGINANIRIIREQKNEYTDNWEQVYQGYLDMSTIEIENNQLAIKMNSGGLESMIKARESEKIEVDRLDTIDGKVIEPLQTVEVLLNTRKIFLESIWEPTKDSTFHSLPLAFFSSSFNVRKDMKNTINSTIKTKSHDEAGSTFQGMNIETAITGGSYNYNGADAMQLIARIDRPRTFNVQIQDLKIQPSVTVTGQINSAFIQVSLVRYSGQNLAFAERYPLWTKTVDVNASGVQNFGGIQAINQELNISLNTEDSLGFEVRVEGYREASSINAATSFVNFNYNFTSGSLIIKEDSEMEDTTTKAIRPFYLAQRLLEIATNRKNGLRSNVLQNGMFKDTLLTHGFWIRGFDKDPDNINDKFKPMTTCFKDLMESFAAIGNLGLGIEKIGHKELVVIEDLNYFYNRNVTVRLPFQIQNVKRYVAEEYFYKSIEIGFEKGGSYEEAQGLDEFNIKNTYTTCITRLTNIYSKIAKYQADTYGIEFARRKPYFLYHTEDTDYDQNVYFIDAKIIPNTNNYECRKWQDDFDSEPQGIYSPETAYNLRLSPFNSLLRHGWVINAGLTKYPNEKIRYASSEGNSKLVTKYPENGTIDNKDIGRARYVPEWVEFDHKCTNDVLIAVQGKSVVFGNEIMNCYGLFEYINEYNQIEKGYLFNLKPNGPGRWKMLKYNG